MTLYYSFYWSAHILLGLASHWHFLESQQAFSPCKRWSLRDTGLCTQLRETQTH